jgi:hypothetical protein
MLRITKTYQITKKKKENISMIKNLIHLITKPSFKTKKSDDKKRRNFKNFIYFQFEISISFGFISKKKFLIKNHLLKIKFLKKNNNNQKIIKINL